MIEFSVKNSPKVIKCCTVSRLKLELISYRQGVLPRFLIKNSLELADNLSESTRFRAAPVVKLKVVAHCRTC